MIRISSGRVCAAVIVALMNAPAANAAEAGAQGAQAPMTGLPGGPLLIPAPNQDLNGVWWAASYSAKIAPTQGGDLPFTPAGRAAYAKNVAGLRDHAIVDQARYTCTPDGVPRIWLNPYPFQIFQTPGQTTLIYERSHVLRVVYMDKELPEPDLLEALPWFSGHSVGKWDGDTLVIESAGFKDSTFLDDTGVPSSDQLRTTERLRKISVGKQLELLVTVTDPVMFTAPWTAHFVFESRPDIRLETQVCGEKQRDVSSVRGAMP